MINHQYKTCLSVVTLVSWFVVIANAIEPFTTGTGTPNDPYEIETVEQLLALGQDPDLLGQCYILMSDLDLDPNLSQSRLFNRSVIAPGDVVAEAGWAFHAFTGVFNGNKHTIRNLVIHSEFEEPTGLFGSNRGLIRNLRLEDCHIWGAQNVGILVGYNRGVLKHCFASGLATGIDTVGGLVGQNQGLITHCSTDVSVMGDQNNIGGLVGRDDHSGRGILEACDSQGSVNGYSSVGGLMGFNEGYIIECTSLCDITGEENVGGLTGTEKGSILKSRTQGTVSGKTVIGGLIGRMDAQADMCLESFSVSSVYADEIGGGLIGSLYKGYRLPVSDCYSIGDVQGSTAGGFIGEIRGNHTKMLADCYAAVVVSGNMSSNASPTLGGFIGHLDYGGPRPPFYSSLWDTQISGQTSGVGLMTHTFDPNAAVENFDVPGKTTAQMTDPNTFIDAGWDFEGTWTQLTEQDYPSLIWEHTLCK